MLLPVLYKLWPRPTQSIPEAETQLPHSAEPVLPLTPPLTPITSGRDGNVILDKSGSYDCANTYLDSETIQLPERQCTLCLEPRGTGDGSGGTVAITECGHIFCWGCLGGLEKVRSGVPFTSMLQDHRTMLTAA